MNYIIKGNIIKNCNRKSLKISKKYNIKIKRMKNNYQLTHIISLFKQQHTSLCSPYDNIKSMNNFMYKEHLLSKHFVLNIYHSFSSLIYTPSIHPPLTLNSGCW